MSITILSSITKVISILSKYYRSHLNRILELLILYYLHNFGMLAKDSTR